MLHHLDSTKKPYIGRKIVDIIRDTPSEVTLLFMDGGKTTLSVHGDCCSHSIFYDIVIPDACRGSEILDVNETWMDREWDEMPDKEYKAHQKEALAKALKLVPDFYEDCLKIWDVVFKTKDGDILIRHINSSNGYYDGDTSYEDEPETH